MCVCLLTMYFSGFVFCFLGGEDGWTRGIGRPSKNRWTFRVLVVLQSELKIRVHWLSIHSVHFLWENRTKNKSSYTMIIIQVSAPKQGKKTKASQPLREWHGKTRKQMEDEVKSRADQTKCLNWVCPDADYHAYYLLDGFLGSRIFLADGKESFPSYTKHARGIGCNNHNHNHNHHHIHNHIHNHNHNHNTRGRVKIGPDHHGYLTWCQKFGREWSVWQPCDMQMILGWMGLDKRWWTRNGKRYTIKQADKPSWMH